MPLSLHAYRQWRGVGERCFPRFDVYCNHKLLPEDFDIVRDSGSEQALKKSNNNARVNAIEIQEDR